MDDDLLIEQVRQHEELYNTSKKTYNDYARRYIIWKQIAKELDTTVTSCKARWGSLRDQLRKILKKRAARRGPRARKLKKWKYEDSMAYLIPYFTVRKSRSNRPLLDNSDEELIEDFQKNDIYHDETTTQNIFQQAREEKLRHSPSTISLNSSNFKKTRRVEKIPASLMKYLRDKSGYSNVVTSSEQIDLFFNGIAATVKKFSPEFQHMAKSRIFAVVSEIELAHLQQ